MAATIVEEASSVLGWFHSLFACRSQLAKSRSRVTGFTKKDLSRVKEDNIYFCQTEDKPLKREDMVKGFEGQQRRICRR